MIRRIVFAVMVGAMWGMSVQSADYLGLTDPWGSVLVIVGAFVIGLTSPGYRSGSRW